ncbi:GumC family protein [Hymenobacter sp.]|jgi:capsular exopolysaccharide synthesis family protein|uniref:GumC family protein n=1 Tax=Hymenobacter sp. TaxID=1898978 RepID=UPI002EDB070D
MEPRPAPSEEIDLHELFFKLRSRWPLFLASLLLTCLAAWSYLKTKEPVYDFKSTLLVSNQRTGSKQTQELLQLLDSQEKVVKLEDEIGILTSTDEIRRTLAQLPFYVSYHVAANTWLNKLGNLQVRERALGSVPFRVLPAPNTPQLTGVPIYVEPQGNGSYRVHADASKGNLRRLNTSEFVREITDVHFDQTVKAGDTLRTPLLTVLLAPERNYPADPEESYYFELHDLNSLTADYQSKLKVRATERESRILELATKGSVPEKETLFLNTLMNQYVQQDLVQKNQVGNRTVAFLDEEINKMGRSRQESAQRLSTYRSQTGVVDVGAQSDASIQQQSTLETRRNKLNTDQKNYENMLRYLRENGSVSQLVALSGAGVEDPAVTNLITQLTELNNRRAALAVSATDNNPMLIELDQQIRSTKESLVSTLSGSARAAGIALRDVEQQLARVQGQMSEMPENERQIGSLQTTTDFNEKKYNFLVEKRNEAAIALATNTTDKKVVDQAAQIGAGPSAPKKPLVMLIALLAALAIPAGAVLLLDKTNRRIQSQEDLAKITNIPLLGVIPHGTDVDKNVMARNVRNPITESFRSIRVNLQYLSAGLDKRIIGVTSSVPGEGKSFCAVNLATELAQSGRRVLLLECDMRRPTITSYFNLPPILGEGLSSYLAGQSTLDQARVASGVPNLDLLVCGPIPDNPTQLLESARMEELLVNMRQEYDYLLIDIPPMGYVSEFIVLLRYLDASIYVVRQNYTDRALVNQINEMHRDRKVQQLYMVINDVHFNKTYEYRHKTKAYSYGYGGGN